MTGYKKLISNIILRVNVNLVVDDYLYVAEGGEACLLTYILSGDPVL